MQSDHKCENMEFYSHLKKKRENTLQCTICVDFTEFYGKTVKEHLHYTVWKLRKFYIAFTHFWQKFRESNGFTDKLLKS